MKNETKDVNFRIKQLKLLRKIIIEKESDIINAIKMDFGKCGFETFTNEIMNSLEEIKLAIKKVKLWSSSKRVKTSLISFKASSKIYYDPYGVTLIITAWNYPFQLAIVPLVGAIAAGNCCIIKPSELAPNTANVINEIISKCFKEEFCAVVQGGKEETTMLMNEKFDFIFYTGSTHVGKIIGESAMKQLTPVVLEMGGKSPCIVDDTADIKLSARRIAWGKFINAGQTCVAPDYLIVHKKVKDDIITAIKREIRSFYGDDPDKSEDYCRIVNTRHFNRLFSLLKEGNILVGGKTDKDKLYIEPTIIDNVTWDSSIMKEEIFGPILPVLEYEDLSDVINMIKSHEKPLSTYVFSKNKSVQNRIIKEASFGGGCINATVLHVASLYMPFGGVGNSGIGNYHGKASFDTFSHKKSILNKSLLFDFKVMYPPYKNKVELLRKVFK